VCADVLIACVNKVMDCMVLLIGICVEPGVLGPGVGNWHWVQENGELDFEVARMQ